MPDSESLPSLWTADEAEAAAETKVSPTEGEREESSIPPLLRQVARCCLDGVTTPLLLPVPFVTEQETSIGTIGIEAGGDGGSVAAKDGADAAGGGG